jgi:glutamate racemase
LKYPVAIIDYGIGGLGLYKLIQAEFPKLPLLYFSDSGEIPYGKLPKAKLRARLEKVFRFLEKEGAEKIIVACHSASSVVLDSDKNVVCLRSQTVNAVTKQKPKSVGIIGGGRTIRSGYYRRELNKAGIRTSQRVAQPLSILVERGEVDTPTVEAAVAKIMKPLNHCQSILLACTHYPVLNDVIMKYVPKGTRLIDPVDELFDSIKKDLLRFANLKGETEFITTGNSQLMVKAAQNTFVVNIKNVRKAKL